MNFKAFKIWYTDYEVTGNTYEEWERAPEDNVQVVVLYSHDGEKVIATDKNTYALTEDMRIDGRASAKKLGTNIPDKDFASIKKKAEKDDGSSWIWGDTVIKHVPDLGGKMIDVPNGDRNTTLSKQKGSK